MGFYFASMIISQKSTSIRSLQTLIRYYLSRSAIPALMELQKLSSNSIATGNKMPADFGSLRASDSLQIWYHLASKYVTIPNNSTDDGYSRIKRSTWETRYCRPILKRGWRNVIGGDACARLHSRHGIAHSCKCVAMTKTKRTSPRMSGFRIRWRYARAVGKYGTVGKNVRRGSYYHDGHTKEEQS